MEWSAKTEKFGPGRNVLPVEAQLICILLHHHYLQAERWRILEEVLLSEILSLSSQGV
jgi:hypothetical protein